MATPTDFHPGDKVMVAWYDGQSYPAVIEGKQGDKIIVKFPNGEERLVLPKQLTARK